jgi:hypothetical protein
MCLRPAIVCSTCAGGDAGKSSVLREVAAGGLKFVRLCSSRPLHGFGLALRPALVACYGGHCFFRYTRTRRILQRKSTPFDPSADKDSLFVRLVESCNVFIAFMLYCGFIFTIIFRICSVYATLQS